MHDILEGALQYEMKLLLRVLIEDKSYFSLDYFNNCLETLELGYMESKSRPTIISLQTFRSSGNSLKQNGKFVCIKYYGDSDVVASQMWLLGRIFPLIIGDCVAEDDDHWLLFLQMMEIVDLLFFSKNNRRSRSIFVNSY